MSAGKDRAASMTKKEDVNLQSKLKRLDPRTGCAFTDQMSSEDSSQSLTVGV